MNLWENAVITNKGKALLAKLVEGNTLQITRAVTGTGYVTPGLLQGQTDVSDIKQTLNIKQRTYPEEGKCNMPCFLTNDDLETGYTAKQVGIYATDPDEGEILFFIAQAPADHGTIIPSKTESPGYNAEWTFHFQYGQADNVTLLLDPSNAVMQQDMEEYVKQYVASEILVATTAEIDAAIEAVSS